MANAGELFVKLGLDMTQFARGLEDAKRRLEQQARDWGSIGMTMSAAITAPLVGIAAASVTLSAEFEKAMNKIQALAYDTTTPISKVNAEMKQMSDLALKLGKDTIFSAAEVADAMGEMAAAGFSAQQIMAGMEGVTALAAAGQLKLAEAASIAAAVLQGFGIDANGMVQVADQIARAAAMSAISVQDIGNAFKFVGPAAKAAGWSLAEVNAALVVLGNSGIKGEMGGTAVRNMISDLIAPSKQAADVLKGLGISVMDNSGKMKHMADIVDQFNAKNLSLADGFKIWGVRFSEVLPLLQAGGDKLRDFTKQLENSNGEAKRMADTMRKGLAGMWEEMKGSLETLGISIGKLLQPAIEPVVKWLTTAANKMIDFVGELDKAGMGVKVFIGVLVGIPAAIGPIALAFSGLQSVMSAVVSLGGATANAISSVANAASGTYNALVNLPGMLSNISFALKNNMVAALSSGELALLQFGKAAVIAAAAFAGWELGNWLYKNIPLVKEFSNTIGDLLVNKYGLGNMALYVTGEMGKLQNWIATTNAKLKEHGVVVEKGALSWADYGLKVREAADKAGIFKQVLSGTDLSLKGIQAAMGNLEMTSAKTLSTIMNGMQLGTVNAQNQKLKVMELNNVLADVTAMHAKLNQSYKEGKITQEEFSKQEAKLAGVMQQTKSVIQQLTGATGKQSDAYARLMTEKDKTSRSTQLLEQNMNKLVTTANKVTDALADLPKTIGDIANQANKVSLIPKDWEGQAAKIDKLKDLYRDLYREWTAAVRDGNIQLADGLKEQLTRVNEAIRGQEKLFDGFKKMDAADSLRKIGDAIDKYMIEKFQEAMRAGTTMADSLRNAMKGPVDEMSRWSEAVDFFGAKTMGELEANAKKTADNFALVTQLYDKGVVGLKSLKEAALDNLETQIELGREQGKNVDGLVLQADAVSKELDAISGKVTKTTDKAKNEWSELWQQISTIVTDLGRDIADAIWSSKNLGEVFTNALEAMGKAVTRFVVEGMVKQLLKALKDSTSQSNVLSKALDSVLDKLGAKPASTPVPSQLPTNSKELSNWGNMFGTGLLGAITAVGTVVSAVTDVLQYLQGRRMEQDIGRIEVTSRGILNQLLSIQETFNKYLPGVQGVNDFLYGVWQPAFASLMNTAEESRDWLQRIYEKIGNVAASGQDMRNAPEKPLPLNSTLPVYQPSGEQTFTPYTQEQLNAYNQNLADMAGTLADGGDAISDAASEASGVLDDSTKDLTGSLTSGGLTISNGIENASEQIDDSIYTWRSTTGNAWVKLTDSIDQATDQVWSSLSRANTTTIAMTEQMATQEAYIIARLAYLQKSAAGSVADIAHQVDELQKQLAVIQGKTTTQTQWNGYNPSLPQAGITFLPGGNLFTAQSSLGGLQPASNLNLSVQVNNADATQVANTMVETWRRAGVTI